MNGIYLMPCVPNPIHMTARDLAVGVFHTSCFMIPRVCIHMLALLCGLAASTVSHQAQPYSASILLRPQRPLHLSSLFNQPSAGKPSTQRQPIRRALGQTPPQLQDHGTEGCRRRYRSLRERVGAPSQLLPLLEIEARGPSQAPHRRLLKHRSTTDTSAQVDYEKFSSICGFGNVPSARANLSRLMAKLTAEGDAAGNASPTKVTDGGEAAQDTPGGKKKGAVRKRKISESILKARALIFDP